MGFQKHTIFNTCISLLLWSLICSLTACSEASQGCLDIKATNYDVTADESCCLDETVVCCCIYPQLTLSINHRLAKDTTANFNFADCHTVEADSSHFFKVDDLRFYISAVELVRDDGIHVGISDTLRISAIDDLGELIETTVADNVNLVKRTEFSYGIGTFEGALETYDSLSFVVGIVNPMNHVLLESLPANHVLARSGADSLYIDAVDGFIFNQINLRKDTVTGAVANLFKISDLSRISLPFSKPVSISAGFDVTINLRINYLEWFKGINFVVDTDEVIQNKIYENTINVFELVD